MQVALAWKPDGTIVPGTVKLIDGDTIVCRVELAAQRVQIGRLSVDAPALQAWLDGQRLNLRTRTVEVLILLAHRPGYVVAVAELDRIAGTRTSKTVAQLRKCLPPGALRNFRGRGYALVPEALA